MHYDCPLRTASKQPETLYGHEGLNLLMLLCVKIGHKGTTNATLSKLDRKLLIVMLLCFKIIFLRVGLKFVSICKTFKTVNY